MNWISSMTFAICLLPKWSLCRLSFKCSRWIWEGCESWLMIWIVIKRLRQKIDHAYRWLRIPLCKLNDLCSEYTGQMYVGPVNLLGSSRGESRCFQAYQRVRYSWRISSPFSSSCERWCLWRSLLTCTIASKFLIDTKLHAILMALVKLITYKTTKLVKQVRWLIHIKANIMRCLGRNNNHLTNSLADYIRLNFVGLQCFKHIMGDTWVS